MSGTNLVILKNGEAVGLLPVELAVMDQKENEQRVLHTATSMDYTALWSFWLLLVCNDWVVHVLRGISIPIASGRRRLKEASRGRRSATTLVRQQANSDFGISDGSFYSGQQHRPSRGLLLRRSRPRERSDGPKIGKNRWSSLSSDTQKAHWEEQSSDQRPTSQPLSFWMVVENMKTQPASRSRAHGWADLDRDDPKRLIYGLHELQFLQSCWKTSTTKLQNSKTLLQSTENRHWNTRRDDHFPL